MSKRVLVIVRIEKDDASFKDIILQRDELSPETWVGLVTDMQKYAQRLETALKSLDKLRDRMPTNA